MSAEGSVSVVVPLYRDVPNLESLFERIGAVFDELDRPVELVLVDDGSRDGTAEKATALAQQFRHPTTVVRLLRNFGQHPAVFAGFAHASGDVVVTLDSDLQYLPEEIPLLLAELTPDFDVVSGYRRERSDPCFRRLVTRMLSSWLSRRTGLQLRDYGSMFRAYDRRVVDRLLEFSERRRYVPGLVGWLGVPVKEIPVSHVRRGEQGSRYRLGPLVDMFLDLITGYAAFPLRILTVVGFAGAILSFALTVIFLVYRVVSGAGPAGLVSAFAVLYFLVAVQLVLIGALGEYVGRVYIEAKARPVYLVDAVVENNASLRPGR